MSTDALSRERRDDCYRKAHDGRAAAEADTTANGLLKKVQQTFLSFAVTDEETCGTMASVYRESGLTLDPHSAVGVHAARLSHIKAVMRMGDAPSSEAAPICCVLTAHPAKFEDACAKAGVPVATCDKVERLKTIRHAFEWLRAPPKNVNKLEAWAAHIKRAVEEAAARRQQAAKPRSRLIYWLRRLCA